jgi:hypothetical protein
MRSDKGHVLSARQAAGKRADDRWLVVTARDGGNVNHENGVGRRLLGHECTHNENQLGKLWHMLF